MTRNSDASRSMTLVEWTTTHRLHGVEMTEPFPEPLQEWHKHRCPCGSTLITLTPAALAALTAASLAKRARR
jgi:hypothetical protein